jgi:hypothetical protein
MALDFKAQVKRDIHNVFLNADEHADLIKVEYNDRAKIIPVVIDNDEARDRGRLSNDSSTGGQKIQGIHVADMVVYISFEDLGIVPRKDRRIKIGVCEYSIIKVSFDEGMITLDLEEYDE